MFRIDPDPEKEIEYVAISEERLNRKKFSYLFPVHSIRYCMDALGIKSLDEIDMLVTDWANIERWHNSGPAYRKAEFDYIKLKLKISPEKIFTVPFHHDAHAASAFYPSGFAEAAILSVDGRGSDLETQTIYYGKGNVIVPLEKGRESGIGKAYNWIGFEVLPFNKYEAPGKVMGLAPYGAKYKNLNVLPLHPVYSGINTDYTELFSRLPHVKLTPGVLKSTKIKEEALDPYFARAAFEIQRECERVMVHLANRAYRLTRSKNLCLAGGVALNSVANKKILDQTPFENIYIQPASSDAGLPLGLCLWGYYMMQKGKTKKRFFMPNAYTGISYSKKEIKKLLDGKKISYRACNNVAEVAKLIAKNHIIGWFQGGSEYGPRALGARSILANAAHPRMKEILNERVKHRESFRPFAPSVLAAYADTYFELKGHASPYMLLVAQVKKNKQKIVPAITHVDGTARVQTVTKEENGIYYDLISAFKKLTGVPLVLNTSYNVAGEPIVETPRDALITFLGTNIDYLYLEGYLISKKENESRATRTREELLRERSRELEERYDYIVKHTLCDGYREEEVQVYADEDNKITNWWVDYRAKYELEKAVREWLKNKSRILIIGSRNTTKLLYEYINEFADLNVVGAHYPIKEADHLGRWEVPFRKYKSISMEQARRTPHDVLLIASYRYQTQLAEKYGKLLKSKEVYKIYDNAGKDLLFVLPTRWPKYCSG